MWLPFFKNSNFTTTQTLQYLKRVSDYQTCQIIKNSLNVTLALNVESQISTLKYLKYFSYYACLTICDIKLKYELSKLIGQFWWVLEKYTNRVLFYIRKQLNSYFELIYSDKAEIGIFSEQ